MPSPVRNTKAQRPGCKISNRVKNFTDGLWNIILPRACIVCHNSLENNAIDDLLCFNCWLKIKKNNPPICAICGRQIRGTQIYKRVCPACQRQNFYFDRALSPCVYEGVMRELIHKFKYQNKDYLSSLLSKLLIEFIHQNRFAIELFDLVISIPLHKVRLKEREFNQAESLAYRIAEQFSICLSTNNLWRKHHRRAQMNLSEEARWENIKSCFALRNPQEVKGKNVLLVDDVLTTGATCSEAASVLRAAGSSSIFVLTLAN